MIDKHSLTAEWIQRKKTKYRKADPSIMERVIFALYLLEQLQLSGLSFIFKGGTSLLLLLKEAKRFSIDIDIVLPTATQRADIEKYLQLVLAEGVFSRFELDERRSFKPGVPKAHYRFYYTSVIEPKEQQILLDILFEATHYPVMGQKEIVTEFIQQETGITPTLVNLPDINSITGDKLTAFAPNTTGIPYGMEKEREIIKQLFDIGNLFDSLDNLETLRTAFLEIADIELIYRNMPDASPTDVLDDIIATGLLLARKDTQVSEEDQAKFKELETGIRQFGYFLYDGTFRLEHAQTASAKAAYLAAMIKTEYAGPIERYTSRIPLSTYLIDHKEFLFLNKKVKNVADGALFYWHKVMGLLYPSTEEKGEE
jgi:hypothetical protein